MRRSAGSGATPAPVVALRALGLGDLLTALPAIRGLRRVAERPLLVATSPGVAPLAARSLPGVGVVAVGELAALPMRGPVDVAVNLHGRGPQSHELLRAIEPDHLVAYDVDGGPPWPDGIHEVERWCRLVDWFAGTGSGAGAGPVDRGDLDIDLAAIDPGAAVDPRLTILHAGATSEARRWPVERWIAVARAEVRRGRRVVLTGSAAEADRCAAIARGAQLPLRADASGRTDVLELAGLVGTAGRVVSGDTGVAHLATAMRRPSVLLFGPTSPDLWGPPPERRRHTVLWSGSTGDPAGEAIDPGLARITATEVVDALSAR